MFLSIVAFLASAGVAPAAAELDSASLPEVFVAACLDGEARLSASQAARRSFDQLPSNIREQLGRPSSGEVWQLSTPGRAYLYILDYEPGPQINPKICGLASDRMDLDAAADALEARIAATVRPNRLRGTEWLRPEDGYVAIATTAAEFNVVQLKWLSEAQRADLLRDVRAVKR